MDGNVSNNVKMKRLRDRYTLQINARLLRTENFIKNNIKVHSNMWPTELQRQSLVDARQFTKTSQTTYNLCVRTMYQSHTKKQVKHAMLVVFIKHISWFCNFNDKPLHSRNICPGSKKTTWTFTSFACSYRCVKDVVSLG